VGNGLRTKTLRSFGEDEGRSGVVQRPETDVVNSSTFNFLAFFHQLANLKVSRTPAIETPQPRLQQPIGAEAGGWMTDPEPSNFGGEHFEENKGLGTDFYWGVSLFASKFSLSHECFVRK